jgi:hypothetical protein
MIFRIASEFRRARFDYQTAAERWKVLRAAGAPGIVSLINPASMDIMVGIALNRAHPPWISTIRVRRNRRRKARCLRQSANAEKFFAGSGHTSKKSQLGKDRKPLPTSRSPSCWRRKRKLKSQARIGQPGLKLPGNDAALKTNTWCSAHLDHIGIGEPINGDRIYNGAMDNGSGSALVLDMAASFKKNPEKLRRSILLVLVTGEEKGLLGSKYFAAHPTVAPKAIAADVNVDMFLPIVPLKFHCARPRRQPGDAREIAQSQGVKVQPDPEPLRTFSSAAISTTSSATRPVIMTVAPNPARPSSNFSKT